jgi:hypothetical protein
MNIFTKSIAFIFLFLTVHFIYGQDNIKVNKAKRNAFKIGISPIPTKIFFSYEHAFTKHISVGGMASYGGTHFVGYTGNIFTRYYFTKFNENGFFVEARGSYGHYNSNVYTSYEQGNPVNGPDDDNIYYFGEHKANINYWNAGISGGYKVFFHEYGHCFFEFIGGVHYGKATFGANDNYLARYGFAYELGSIDVKEVFKNTGPAFPLHFIINFGFAF